MLAVCAFHWLSPKNTFLVTMGNDVTPEIQSAELSLDDSANGVSDFVNTFKKMLVCRYNWTVAKANEFSSPELLVAYNEGLNKHQAYFKVFNVQPNLGCGNDVVFQPIRTSSGETLPC